MKTNSLISIKNISKLYFVSRNQFNLLSLSNGSFDYHSPFYLFYRDVEIALSLLEQEEKLIIQNEFFMKSNLNWWEEFFDKKEYMKKRDQAILKFVRYFHEIH